MVEIPIPKKKIFIPGCVTEPDGTVKCKPKLIKGDIKLEAPRPILLRKIESERGSFMEILDDGDAQAELIDELRRYVEKRHL